jgi:glyoxylase-like metal-dependent hydrolase (beta-lactamase superfamily II)
MTSFTGSVAEFDLGGRVVEVIGIPGHEDNHIAVYDRKYGLLYTGDTLYPGRLFIDDFAAYKESIAKLVSFTEARDTCAILGTHIEMSNTPGDQYDFGATHHPDEHDLQLSREVLVELNEAIQAMGSTAEMEVHDDFIVFPL